MSTTITVRALAFGGKFIGSHVGFAQIDIYAADDLNTPLASGLTNQSLAAGTDGSGVTPLIMTQTYPWGFPVRADLATEFTAAVVLGTPTLLTFVATSVADPRISVRATRWVIPQQALTGPLAVTMVIPGLLVGCTLPHAGITVNTGIAVPIAACVRMMCGCMIDNLFWPASNFEVSAQITGAAVADTVTLKFTGEPSSFSGTYTFATPGKYTITIIATEMNGNIGSALPIEVEVVSPHVG